MTDLRELIARAACEGVGWKWDDGLGDGAYLNRLMFERQTDAIIAAMDKAGLVVVAKPQERKGCVKCGEPFAWNHGFVWLENDTRMHRDCANPTTAKRWKK